MHQAQIISYQTIKKFLRRLLNEKSAHYFELPYVYKTSNRDGQLVEVSIRIFRGTIQNSACKCISKHVFFQLFLSLLFCALVITSVELSIVSFRICRRIRHTSQLSRWQFLLIMYQNFHCYCYMRMENARRTLCRSCQICPSSKIENTCLCKMVLLFSMMVIIFSYHSQRTSPLYIYPQKYSS